jgi:ABC-type antimicrobial peptide transport system permease subunit
VHSSHPTGIALRLADDADVSQVRGAVEDMLSELLGEGVGPHLVSSDLDLFGDELTQLGKDVLAEAVFLMLGLVIATATVAELLYAGVQANVREIGTLRSLGATRGDIIWQVLTQGLFICLVGGGLGLLLAQSYPLWPEALREQFRWMSSPHLGTLALGLSLTAGAGASWLPASAAVRTDPVTALRESER